MRSAYRKLRPILRRFVDGLLAGENPTHIVRRLRPGLEHPHCCASKWKRRADVQAAIAERQAEANDVKARVALLEQRIAALEARSRDPEAAARATSSISGPPSANDAPTARNPPDERL